MFINNNDIEYIRSILQNSEEWITVKGNHIKLEEGETKEEAVKRFIKEKQKQKITGYEKSDPENAVKFIKPSFEITSDRKETIKNFYHYYKINLQGKSVENPLLGKVCFYGSGERETTSKNLYNIENLKYISVVLEILKTSKDITEEKQKHFHHNVKHLYRVSGFIDTDNIIIKISIVILEDENGNKFYTFEVEQKRASNVIFVIKRALIDTPIGSSIIKNNQNVNENRFYTFDARNVYEKEISNNTPVTARVLKTSIDNTIINNTNLVNSFELNLYVTETDFRMFEINF